jgi:hypothetical protein
MSLTTGLRRVTRALSDGTGLSEEEIGLLVAATASVTVVFGLIRAVDALMNLDLWPTPPNRSRR